MRFNRTRRALVMVTAVTAMGGAPAALAQTGPGPGLEDQLRTALVELDHAAGLLSVVESSIDSEAKEVRSIAADFARSGDKAEASRRLDQLSAEVDTSAQQLADVAATLTFLQDEFRKIEAEALREKMDPIAKAAADALSDIGALQTRIKADTSRIGDIRKSIDDLRKKVDTSA